MALVGRRTLAAALAAVLALTLTAGSCRPSDDAAEEPAPDISYEEVPTRPAGTPDPRNLQALVPVPAGTSPRAVEFADETTGYALFSSCVAGQPCKVGLVLTLDGGQSWLARKVPFDDATEVEMRLGRGNVLLLRAVPGGWYVSRDTGRTFQQHPIVPPPAEVALTEPRFAAAGCLDGTTDCADKQPVETGADGRRVALAGRPAGNHRFTSLVAQADGRLWLSAQATDADPAVLFATVTVWSSGDRGRTWRPEGTAKVQPKDIEPQLVVAPDGSDAWLAAGRYAARHLPGNTWTEATAMREVSELYSAEVLPGGVLLVASGQGIWLVDVDQRLRDQRGRQVFRLRRLSATTILGYPAQQSGEVWLCAVQDKKCEWSRVAVTAR